MSADALEQVLGLSLGTTDDDYCPRWGRLHSAARPPTPRLRERGGQWGQAQAGATGSAVGRCAPVSGHSPWGSLSQRRPEDSEGWQFSP